jgi:hypothetical protein
MIKIEVSSARICGARNIVILSGLLLSVFFLFLWLGHSRPTGDDYCAAAYYVNYGYIGGVLNIYMVDTPFLSGVIPWIATGAGLDILGLPAIWVQGILSLFIIFIVSLILYKTSTGSTHNPFTPVSLLIAPIWIIGAVGSPLAPPGGFVIAFFTWVTVGMKFWGVLAGVLITVLISNYRNFTLTNTLFISALAFFAGSGFIETTVNLVGISIIVAIAVVRSILNPKNSSPNIQAYVSLWRQIKFGFLAISILLVTIILVIISGGANKRVVTNSTLFFSDGTLPSLIYRLFHNSFELVPALIFKSMTLWLLIPLVGGLILNSFFIQKRISGQTLFSLAYTLAIILWTFLSFYLTLILESIGYSAWWHYAQISLLLNLSVISIGGLLASHSWPLLSSSILRERCDMFVSIGVGLLALLMPYFLYVHFNEVFGNLKLRAAQWDQGKYVSISELANEDIVWVQECIKQMSPKSPLRSQLSNRVGGTSGRL